MSLWVVLPVVVALAWAAAVKTLFARPALYDYFNTVRDVLKYNDIRLYLVKQQEYNDVVNQLGLLCRAEVSEAEVGACLIKLRTSPFFPRHVMHDFDCAWRAHARGLDEIRWGDLPIDRDGCEGCNAPAEPDKKVTKQELLRMLYERLWSY